MGFPDSCDRGADSFGEVLGRTGRNRTFDGIYAPVKGRATAHCEPALRRVQRAVRPVKYLREIGSQR